MSAISYVLFILLTDVYFITISALILLTCFVNLPEIWLVILFHASSLEIVG